MLNNEKKLEIGKIFTIAIITATIIFLPFVIYDKGLFLLHGDFNVQQIPFYEMAHEAIKNGNTAWNFNTDLGANFVGSYSFYLLGSPFFWITLLFPTSFVPFLMAPLLILKFGVAAVTSYAFIRRFSRTSSFAMIGGLLFAFCGFNVYNIFFNHFNEAVAFFPLLLLTLERAVVDKKRGEFALAVFLNLIVNYVFFVGEVIFLAIYFAVRCFDKNFRVNVKDILILILESVIGVFGGMFLLLPSVLAISGNVRITQLLLGWNFLLYNDVQRYPLILHNLFFPPDAPATSTFFPDSDAKWSSVAVFLPLFTMTGVIAFFRSKKKHFTKILIIISVIIAFIPGLNSIFYGFNDSYYARWFYMPILMMCIMTVLALENRKSDFKYAIKFTLIAISVFSAIILIPSYKDGKIVVGGLPENALKFVISVVIAGACLWIVNYLIKTYRKKPKLFINNSIYFVCLISVLYSVVVIIYGKSISYSYEQVVDKGIHGASKIDLPKDEFYRVDVYQGMDNWPMFWRLPTIQAFHSVVPPSTQEFYMSLGVDRFVASRPDQSYDGLRGLTSVKYLLAEDYVTGVDVVAGFEYMDTRGGFTIYENKYFIPMGFTYDKYITKETFNNYPQTERDKLLLKGILLDNPEKYSDILTETRQSPLESISEYDYLNIARDRQKETAYNFTTNNEGFTANINLSKSNLVFFSVPYDKGFKAYVNGEQVEIEKANVGFMAVKGQPGENEIVFTYTTPGLKLGTIISIISLILFIIYIYINYIFKKRKNLTLKE